MLKDNFSYFASCYGTSKHDKNTVIFSRISEYIGPLIAFTEEPQNTLNAAANQRGLKSTKIDFLDLDNWKYSAAFAQLAGFKLENAFLRRKIFIFINISAKYIYSSIFCCKTTKPLLIWLLQHRLDLRSTEIQLRGWNFFLQIRELCIWNYNSGVFLLQPLFLEGMLSHWADHPDHLANV